MFYETMSIDNNRLSGKRGNTLKREKKTAIQSESQLKLANAMGTVYAFPQIEREEEKNEGKTQSEREMCRLL